jgi:hypothetical protein
MTAAADWASSPSEHSGPNNPADPDLFPAFDYQPPVDAGGELRTVAALAGIVDELRGAVTDLAAIAHHRLPEPSTTAFGASAALDEPPIDLPAGLRWEQLNDAAATAAWRWLLTWTWWLVQRYELHAELGACWVHHPGLVEELTALCASWHGAYNPDAGPDGPLRWHEALARARIRWREWDEHTNCRHGRHQQRRPDLAWPTDWLAQALDAADPHGGDIDRPDPWTIAAQPQLPVQRSSWATDSTGEPS